ncbi:MAG TPA: 6-carboxytetrahydropterin synthase, partial [Stellaceae bacterium]
AAHFLPSAPEGHPNRRMHGHSFRLDVAVAGEPDPETGVILHFAEFERALDEVREALDHRLLNEINGLQTPTLEHLVVWVAGRLAPKLPGLARVTVRRDSIGESCTYYLPPPGADPA